MDVLIRFVSLPDCDGRLPMYSVVADASSSDCSSFSASGEDEPSREMSGAMVKIERRFASESQDSRVGALGQEKGERPGGCSGSGGQLDGLLAGALGFRRWRRRLHAEQ